jgi:hypothetical protein
MFFVPHSNTTAVIEFVDALLKPQADGSRGMGALYGCGGAGKSYLLRYLSSPYWVQERLVQEPRVIHIAIDEHRLGSLKGKGAIYSTAEACVTFSAIAEQLGALSGRYDPESAWANCAWYKKPRPLYGDNAFLSLVAFVRNELLRLKVVAIFIDNAHRIDTYTVQRLVQVRALLDDQLALVLCAPIEKPGTLNEHVDGLITRSGAADQFETPIELQRLEEEAFTGEVLNNILAHMNAMFAEVLPPLTKALMRKVFWAAIASDWRVVAKKLRDLDRALGPQRGQVREITQEVFERVIGRLPAVLVEG